MAEAQNVTLSLPRALLKRAKRLAADEDTSVSALMALAKLSFWDAMIVHPASESGCERSWSEDLNDSQAVRGVRIRNPFS